MSDVVQSPAEKNIRKRRPPPLDLDAERKLNVCKTPNTGSLNALRTPKDLVNNIAIQCVSPVLPSYADDSTIFKSKAIEAQQRLLIAQKAQRNTPIKSTFDAKSNLSVKKHRPENITIYHASQVVGPRIKSAPAYQRFASPMIRHLPVQVSPNSTGSETFPRTASIINDRERSPDQRRSISLNDTTERKEAEDEDDKDSKYADPEDAALSDDDITESKDDFSKSAKKAKFMDLCSQIYDLMMEK